MRAKLQNSFQSTKDWKEFYGFCIKKCAFIEVKVVFVVLKIFKFFPIYKILERIYVKKAYYYLGDYYCVIVDSFGRLETFYKEEWRKGQIVNCAWSDVE